MLSNAEQYLAMLRNAEQRWVMLCITSFNLHMDFKLYFYERRTTTTTQQHTKEMLRRLRASASAALKINQKWGP